MFLDHVLTILIVRVSLVEPPVIVGPRREELNETRLVGLVSARDAENVRTVLEGWDLADERDGDARGRQNVLGQVSRVSIDTADSDPSEVALLELENRVELLFKLLGDLGEDTQDGVVLSVLSAMHDGSAESTHVDQVLIAVEEEISISKEIELAEPLIVSILVKIVQVSVELLFNTMRVLIDHHTKVSSSETVTHGSQIGLSFEQIAVTAQGSQRRSRNDGQSASSDILEQGSRGGILDRTSFSSGQVGQL